MNEADKKFVEEFKSNIPYFNTCQDDYYRCVSIIERQEKVIEKCKLQRDLLRLDDMSMDKHCIYSMNEELAAIEE